MQNTQLRLCHALKRIEISGSSKELLEVKPIKKEKDEDLEVLEKNKYYI